jgi:hypothetical protein
MATSYMRQRRWTGELKNSLPRWKAFYLDKHFPFCQACLQLAKSFPSSWKNMK